MNKSVLRDLSKDEIKWLYKIVGKNFMGKEIILEQLKNAKVIGEYNTGFISLKIFVKDNIPQYPYQVRVPVEMRVHSNNQVPTVFLLHVINGYIDELEIFKADSSEMNKDIVIENEEIIIDERVKTESE